MKIIGLGGLAAAIGGGLFGVSRAAAGNRYYSGPVSDHFDGKVFFNPGGTPPASFTDLLRWQFGGGKVAWPDTFESPYPPARPHARVDDLRITMVGHATMLVQAAGVNMLFDPLWSDRASPVSFAGPKRINAPGIAFEDLPPIDVVLVSHNHYDHLDVATLARLKAEHDPVVLTPLGNDTIIRRAVPDMRTVARDWGETAELGPVKFHLEPVHHWSARGTGDRRMALWAGFVIETPAGTIYHVGDTGFFGGRNYDAVREKYGAIRLAILPFGAYEPRWFMEPQHQNPEEAVEGMERCGAAFAAGHHWATFQLTDEAIEEPRDRLYAALDAHSIARDRFRPMLPGEAWDVPPAGTVGVL